MAYMWTDKNTKPEEAMSFLKAGLEANTARFVSRDQYRGHGTYRSLQLSS